MSFCDLNTTRFVTGEAVNQINIFDMYKYAEMKGYKDVDEFVSVMKSIDSHYIDLRIKKMQRTMKTK
ncbi:hypothetical protein LO80_03180 [Candidatus Francisella endociliophora]|uniref:Uncharacterized protein n=1 Tax=Candidatus Francisella endociliophora TaxID=653937 RepID=A0A097ENC8_9GAMM|nr:hypothetical protein [Francisella sp. FSC1006]AIT09072.1 hypothetical protein LO80_03180 [Francisella sp. FSC1006]